MSDAFIEFLQHVTDPQLVFFCTLIVGFASGWAIAMVSGAAAELYEYFVSRKHKKDDAK